MDSLEHRALAALEDDGSLLAVNLYHHEHQQAFAPGERANLERIAPRELDVCERLLRGWSHDGIAADLGLSVATVKTYRARAFDQLGLSAEDRLLGLVRGLRAGRHAALRRWPR